MHSPGSILSENPGSVLGATQHPQADLATEPRWPRATATFGSNPVKVGDLSAAYIEGFQGSTAGLKPDGVATVLKHFSAYGAAVDGFDGHNQYGRLVNLDSSTFKVHLQPFSIALKAQPAGVMPAYPVIEGVKWKGKPLELVAPGFSRTMLREILRRDMGFGGLILSDWAITNDCPAGCISPSAENPQQIAQIGMPWGVEQLHRKERVAKAINAGVDQLGGMDDPTPLVSAVKAGLISRARIDEAVRKVMVVKFQLGLFDKPFVDAAKAEAILGNPESVALAEAAQRNAQVLLRNQNSILPLRSGIKVWSQGLDAAAVAAAGLVPVSELADAQVAIVRASTPHDMLHPHHFFGKRQNEGRLDFRPGDVAFDSVWRASAKVPVIFVADMDRPAVLTGLIDQVQGLLAVFGASDTAVLDVILGKVKPRGRLPFELPRSMDAVSKQNAAAPDDSADPLFAAGAGLTEGD